MTAPPARPHVLLSCAVSLDGYLDDATASRLVLSNDADWDRVDQLRADADAILVGAETVRRDDPRLAVRSAARRAARAAAGRPEHPLRAILTTTAALDPASRIFGAPTVVYTTSPDAPHLTDRATVVPIPPTAAPPTAGPSTGAAADPLAGSDAGPAAGLELGVVLADLAARGVERLMVEGGGRVNTAFLTAGLVDELHLAVAPFFVGDPAAPHFVGPGTFPADPQHRMTLLETSRLGDMAVLRYRLP